MIAEEEDDTADEILFKKQALLLAKVLIPKCSYWIATRRITKFLIEKKEGIWTTRQTTFVHRIKN